MMDVPAYIMKYENMTCPESGCQCSFDFEFIFHQYIRMKESNDKASLTGALKFEWIDYVCSGCGTKMEVRLLGGGCRNVVTLKRYHFN